MSGFAPLKGSIDSFRVLPDYENIIIFCVDVKKKTKFLMRDDFKCILGRKLVNLSPFTAIWRKKGTLPP